jgi:hypothetical protein
VLFHSPFCLVNAFLIIINTIIHLTFLFATIYIPKFYPFIFFFIIFFLLYMLSFCPFSPEVDVDTCQRTI